MIDTYPMGMVTAPGKIEYVERNLPELTPNDILIQVMATAICGSDLHIFKGKHPSAPLPMAIGHEISGEVISVGDDVTRVKVGDRVAVEPVIACDTCCFCERGQYHLCSNISFQYRQGQGGFAPYFVVKERWAHKLPENLTYEEGALIEPLSVAVHAIRKANIRLGMTTAIYGDGAIGLLILMLTKLTGGGKTFVVGIQDHRLEIAAKLGADQIINNLSEDSVEQIFNATQDMGVDRSFEAVGIEPTLVKSLQVLKKGGLAVLVGIFESPQVKIPANLFIQREISLSGSQGYNWDFQRAIEIAAMKDIPLKELITHTIPIEQLQDGFDMLLNADYKAIKVVVSNQ